MKSYILKIELCPSSSWFNNVRSAVTKSQWNIIKEKVASKAYYICEICKGVGDKHPVECHEVWHFDEKKCIQKLIKMIALCPKCHSVKHFGLAEVLGKRHIALAHLMKINDISNKEAESYIASEFNIWSKRNLIKWQIDISLLKEYDINVEKIEKNKKA